MRSTCRQLYSPGYSYALVQTRLYFEFEVSFATSLMPIFTCSRPHIAVSLSCVAELESPRQAQIVCGGDKVDHQEDDDDGDDDDGEDDEDDEDGPRQGQIVCWGEDGEDEDGVDDEDHYHDAKLTFTPSKARQYCLWG